MRLEWIFLHPTLPTTVSETRISPVLRVRSAEWISRSKNPALDLTGASGVEQTSLSLGDLIDCALNSRDLYSVRAGSKRRSIGQNPQEDFFLDKETGEVGKEHSYRLEFQNQSCGIGLPFDEFAFRPLLLTDEDMEYLEVRPAEAVSQ
jgi:hypothetical protein